MLFLLILLPLHELSPITDGADRVELNHYYDDKGKWIFDQVIWYDYDKIDKVVEWKHIKDGREEDPDNIAARAKWVEDNKDKEDIIPFCPKPLYHQWYPRYDHKRKVYASIFWDVNSGRLRHVTAKSFVETWTQHDPELLNRDTYSKEQRRKFSLPKRN